MLLRRLAAANPGHDHYRLGAVLLKLGNQLRQSGRNQEALTHCEEAAALLRHLASEEPTSLAGSSLGHTLLIYSDVLMAVGQTDKALAVAEEGVAYVRRLAEADPHGNGRLLGQSLSALSEVLHGAGRIEESLAAAKESLANLRPLAESHPNSIALLGSPLKNLFIGLFDSERWEQALAVAEEIVARYREPAALNPEVYAAHLVKSLYNLGSILGALERRQEAITAVEEIVDIWEYLATHARIREGSDLPETAVAAVSLLQRLGSSQKAAQLHRGLAAMGWASSEFEPTEYRSSEAVGVHKRALDLVTKRKFKAAADAYRQAIDLYQEADDRPREAQAWSEFGTTMTRVRRLRRDAPEAHQHAADLYRKNGDITHQAVALHNLSFQFFWARRFKETEEAAQVAISLYRECGDENNEARAEVILGMAQFHLKKYDSAAETLLCAADHLQKREEPGTNRDMWRYLAFYLMISGRFAEGRSSYARARRKSI